MKYIFPALSAGLFFTTFCFAQSSGLPVKYWNSDASHVLVIYLSGDGGINKFSSELCTNFNEKGYPVYALDSRSYFWNRKSPRQAADDIATLIDGKLSVGGIQHFVIVGYSFGADVLPFIINNLPSSARSRLLSVTLLSPSPTTDFQIHILDMLGAGKKRRMDVLAAINQMQSPKTLTIFGSGEKDFPIKKLTLKNNKVELLPGGHHFEGNTTEVANMIISNF